MAPLGQASRPEIDNIDLFESAAICERRITALRKHAINLKLEYTSGKKRTLLDDVITRSNSNIKSLRAWTVAVRQGRQTSSYEIRASINEVFNNILLLLAKAKKALDHRLQLSCLAWPKSKYDPTQSSTPVADLDIERQALKLFGRHWMRSRVQLDIFIIKSRPYCGILPIRKDVRRNSKR